MSEEYNDVVTIDPLSNNLKLNTTLYYNANGSNISNISIQSPAGRALSDILNQDHPSKFKISTMVKELEGTAVYYSEEFYKIREQILAMRAILGLPRTPEGAEVRLSTAIKELAVELDKRIDCFGNIDPVIKL